MSEDDWKRMLAAQCTWDATMGYNAVQALEKQGDATAIIAHPDSHLRREARSGHRRQRRLRKLPLGDRRGNRSALPLARRLDARGESDGPLQVIDVEKDSPGAKAGVAVQDVLVSLDGAPVKDRETLSRLMAEKNWGDAAKLVVQRDGKDIALTVLFRREPRAPATPAPSASRGSP